MRKNLVIHPFLLAAYPVLFLFSQNIDQLSFSDIFTPLATGVGSALILFLTLGFVLKEFTKAGMIVSIFIVLFFSYGHVFSVVEAWPPAKLTTGKHIILELIWILTLVFSIIFFAKTQKDLKKATGFLNITALVLVLISVANIVTYEFQNRTIRQKHDPFLTNEKILKESPELSAKYRDIYYIILDAYASDSTLKEIYNYDNHDFTDFLTNSGFYVASKSCSNFAETFLSLASSLNMEYINYLSDKAGIKSRDQTIPNSMIHANRVTAFLKAKGYKIVHFYSGWGPTRYAKYADIVIKYGLGNNFMAILCQSTMLNPLQKNIFGSGARERILGIFKGLAKTPEISGPKFVFSHIVSPHPPYLFDADGKKVPKSAYKLDGPVWSEKDLYINQLIFVNKQMRIVIQELLLKSEIPPIIILQGDHGSASTFYEPESGGWNRPTVRELRERMRILNAYYFPPDMQKLLYDSISPVNTFRLIFNQCFNADYEMLEDRSYYSTYQKPYQFMDVTDQVNGE